MIQKASAVYSAGKGKVDLGGGSVGLVMPFSKRRRASALAALASMEGGSQTLLSLRLAPPSKPLPRGFPTGWVMLGLLLLMGTPYLFSVHVAAGVLAILCVGAMFFRAWVGRGRQVIDLAQRMRNWRSAAQRWDTLYYCARDDILFLPGESDYASPEDMSPLLHGGGGQRDVQG